MNDELHVFPLITSDCLGDGAGIDRVFNKSKGITFRQLAFLFMTAANRVANPEATCQELRIKSIDDSVMILRALNLALEEDESP